MPVFVGYTSLAPIGSYQTYQISQSHTSQQSKSPLTISFKLKRVGYSIYLTSANLDWLKCQRRASGYSHYWFTCSYIGSNVWRFIDMGTTFTAAQNVYASYLCPYDSYHEDEDGKTIYYQTVYCLWNQGGGGGEPD